VTNSKLKVQSDLKQYKKLDDISVEHFDISRYTGLVGGRPLPRFG